MNDICKITGGKHNLTLARQRGSRIRHRCTACGGMTGWVKDENVKRERVASQKATLTQQLTGHERLQAVNDHAVLGMTVPELKDAAKRAGKTGYSKLKKDELVTLLTNGRH